MFVVIECLLLFCDIDFPIGGLEPRVNEISFQEYVSEGISHPVCYGSSLQTKEGQMRILSRRVLE